MKVLVSLLFMTVCVCSYQLSMQNDVLNDQLPNENDYSSSLSTSAIYSGLELVC